MRSGHGVFSNHQAVLENIRILHLEQRFSKTSTWRSSSSHRPILSTASPLQSHSRNETSSERNCSFVRRCGEGFSQVRRLPNGNKSRAELPELRQN